MKDMSFKLVPQGTSILIQLKPVEEHTTRGGIVLPDVHGEESRTGSIIAVGEDVDRIESPIFLRLWNAILKFFTGKDHRKKKHNPGDKIVISFVSGTPLHFPSEGILDDTIRVITQSNIMLKIGG